MTTLDSTRQTQTADSGGRHCITCGVPIAPEDEADARLIGVHRDGTQTSVFACTEACAETYIVGDAAFDRATIVHQNELIDDLTETAVIDYASSCAGRSTVS